jgi:L-lysine 2,3-aminomutase
VKWKREKRKTEKENIMEKKVTPVSIEEILESHRYPGEIVEVIKKEDLLPQGLVNRLHGNYPEYSHLIPRTRILFREGKPRYSGLKGFREIVSILESNGINMGHLKERELFIEIYRFMATRHVLNSINWDNFEKDSLFQLVFPQPGMVNPEFVREFMKVEDQGEEARERLIQEYIARTNPHDGNQKLNKPWFEDDEGDLVILEGSQHKYPQCQLLFDKTTQNCFAFCTYCFRHAQVRGDEDMFIQYESGEFVNYLKQHKEVTDFLITGGDGAYMPFERLQEYALPLIEDPELTHIKTLRIGTRVLSYQPEMILESNYNKFLDLFKRLVDNGVQVAFMNHFSTPGEILNPMTIAALRRLKAYGLTLKSQSPIMNHVSLFTDENGKVDVDRSAKNWIDLGNIFAMLQIGFHSMYCARPTGEHHYFTVPVAEINRVFQKIYRSLPSINRPSRYITMTSSAGKISILGETVIKGEKLFALKFNEARNMEWMDRVFLAKYDGEQNTVARLLPYEGEEHFYESELKQIEEYKQNTLKKRIDQYK